MSEPTLETSPMPPRQAWLGDLANSVFAGSITGFIVGLVARSGAGDFLPSTFAYGLALSGGIVFGGEGIANRWISGSPALDALRWSTVGTIAGLVVAQTSLLAPITQRTFATLLGLSGGMFVGLLLGLAEQRRADRYGTSAERTTEQVRDLWAVVVATACASLGIFLLALQAAT